MRHCLNCGAIKSIKWLIYLKENYLCYKCGDYNRKFGKHRPKELWNKIKKDRKCFNCGVTRTPCWRFHSKLGHDLCNACGCKQRGYSTKKRPNKNLKEKDLNV
uniref:GATA-type domain-containing protein n=1 Tax=Meloidogyne enterolobii TaxID=390850 RepID=A0A6V7XYH0_MELEN|nr:unnamed protein product [Meloidogyne enterolobii]